MTLKNRPRAFKLLFDAAIQMLKFGEVEIELKLRPDELQIINTRMTPNDQELSHAAGDFRQPETRSAN
jgi:hypothetical protein